MIQETRVISASLYLYKRLFADLMNYLYEHSFIIGKYKELLFYN